MLAERLRRLEGAGIIASTPYQQHPKRYAYTLTPKGSALGDVLLAFVRWAKQHIPGTVTLNRVQRAVTSKRPRRDAGGADCWD
jgi:DNA-binding HxlR family transcriptional regulator